MACRATTLSSSAHNQALRATISTRDEVTNVKPWLTTEPMLREILQELRSREPIFHRPELGNTRADFARMTAEDFWEVGASGRRYSRDHVLDVLEDRHQVAGHLALEDTWETTDFACRELGSATYLLTYTLLQGQRKTRRVTIWRRSADDWKIMFHQGTVVEDDTSE
ncbi:MAG TPA: DUF4440 domain-containing protein [Steroidobacteraceae bacterium]|nr:DUF4440 domain-containing protein [Steroidobacteraceae bacterium]